MHLPKYERRFYNTVIILLSLTIGGIWSVKCRQNHDQIISFLSAPSITDTNKIENEIKNKIVVPPHKPLTKSVKKVKYNFATIVNNENDLQKLSVPNNPYRTLNIDVSIKDQKVYVYRNDQLIYTFKCSTSSSGILMPPNEHPDYIHDNIGTYQVLSKDKNHWSRQYDCDMPWAIHYHGGHYIHATDKINELGKPASHGCVRLHPKNAKILFDLVSIGDTISIHY